MMEHRTMMIVPAYWAEARLQARFRGRPVVVRRFGWSDEGLPKPRRTPTPRQ
jgi:hypothetical protein